MKFAKLWFGWLLSDKRWYNKHPFDNGWQHNSGDHV